MASGGIVRTAVCGVTRSWAAAVPETCKGPSCQLCSGLSALGLGNLQQPGAGHIQEGRERQGLAALGHRTQGDGGGWQRASNIPIQYSVEARGTRGPFHCHPSHPSPEPVSPSALLIQCWPKSLLCCLASPSAWPANTWAPCRAPLLHMGLSVLCRRAFWRGNLEPQSLLRGETRAHDLGGVHFFPSCRYRSESCFFRVCSNCQR